MVHDVSVIIPDSYIPTQEFSFTVPEVGVLKNFYVSVRGINSLNFGTSTQITLNVILTKVTPLGNGQGVNYQLSGPNVITAAKIIQNTDDIQSGVYSFSNTITQLAVNPGDMVLCFTYINGDNITQNNPVSLKYNVSAGVVFSF